MEFSLTLVELGVSASAAVASSAVLGWWWRGRSLSTKRAVLDELWTRKLRSMEVALEESESHRTREGTGLRLLQGELESTRDALASAKQAYQDATDEIAELKESLDRRRIDVDALDRAGAEMAERRKQALAELEKERERSATLAAKVKRLAPLPARIAEREEELARLDRKHAAELDSRDAEVRRMTDWIAELSSLPDALKSREADVRELRERLRAEVAKGEERAAEAHEQLAVLDAEKLALVQRDAELEQALATRQAELELLRAEHEALTANAAELTSRVDQLEGAAAAVDARIERERQSLEDQAASQRDQASSERERLARRLVEREEDLRNAQRALAAARAESEGASVELRSLQRRVEELNRADARRRDGKADAPREATPAKSKSPQATDAATATQTATELDETESVEALKHEPIDELALAVSEAILEPSLFTDALETPPRPTEAAETDQPDVLAQADDAAAPEPSDSDPYTAAVEAARRDQAAEAALEDAEADAREDTVDATDSAAPLALEPADESDPDEALELAAELAAELGEDEPAVILEPHRAAPPSMPTFPGTDGEAEAAPTKALEPPAAEPDEPRASRAAPSSNGSADRGTANAPKSPESQNTAADDFTRIRGIGPRTADKLVAAGITNFADFASLSGDTLAEIAEAIGATAAKIKSSGWQKSARRLAKSKR
jgi:predicted flap endonuclease-1-like 5' DNA nuclease